LTAPCQRELFIELHAVYPIAALTFGQTRTGAKSCKSMGDLIRARNGEDWLMLANPAYGSFESAPYGHDFKLSDDERLVKKLGVLLPWPAKP
jgi:predicted secreted acid phosphatase